MKAKTTIRWTSDIYYIVTVTLVSLDPPTIFVPFVRGDGTHRAEKWINTKHSDTYDGWKSSDGHYPNQPFREALDGALEYFIALEMRWMRSYWTLAMMKLEICWTSDRTCIGTLTCVSLDPARLIIDWTLKEGDGRDQVWYQNKHKRWRTGDDRGACQEFAEALDKALDRFIALNLDNKMDEILLNSTDSKCP